MARPNQSEQRRAELVPVLAKAFAELGYRRATTAALAKRCQLRENQLYRLWPSKKAMFLASIDYLYEFTAAKWRELLAQDGDTSPTERLLNWEGEHRGETGLHRITFAGLNEADDPEVREALKRMYKKFHRFLIDQIKEHRSDTDAGEHPDAAITAWAVIGLGTMTNIANELGLLNHKTQTVLIRDVGKLLMDGGQDGA
jgi:AcrR family transcriptional regulator